MSAHPIQQSDSERASALAHRLHRVVTRGPWDLDIVAAMRSLGCDETWWAEGECLLAALVDSGVPDAAMLEAAWAWYEEAERAAHQALVGSPQLLDRLGLPRAKEDYN